MKQSRLYRIEDIINPNICTIVLNSKEYSGKFKNRSINKKYKGVRLGALEMNYEVMPKKFKD